MSRYTKQVIADCIQWDVYNWSQALHYWQPVLTGIKNKEERKVLCLGERDGGLALWFALQGFQVVCTDIYGVTPQAEQLHKSYSVSKDITYDSVDIFQMNYPAERFDIVVCKSVIGGLKTTYSDPTTRTLDNQKRAIREIRRVLKKGGFFLGAENLKGSKLHQYYRKKVKGKKIGWRHLSRTEVEWLFSDYEVFKHKSFGFLGTFYPSKVLNRVFFYFDWLLSRLFSPEWLYIDFLIAQK